MNALRIATLMLSVLLTACMSTGRSGFSDVASHDFSPAPSPAPTLPVRSIDVVGSHWLLTPAMHYRMGNSTQRQQFAQNRWVAPPPEMVSLRLKRGLPARPTAGLPESKQCNLRLELDDLVQVFGDKQSSELVLQARANLFSPQGIVARRTLTVSIAAGANAASAAAASGALLQQLAEELAVWSTPYCS